MSWASKGLSDETIKHSATSNNSLSPKLYYFNNPKFRVNFDGSCLRTNRACTPNKIMNIYIVFETKSCPFHTDNDFKLRNVLFRAVKSNKNPDPDKCSYSGYGIHMDITFGADMSSSAHIDGKKKIS